MITRILPIVVFVLWPICGVIAAGVEFAIYQRSFPSVAEKYRNKDLCEAYKAVPLGPIALLVVCTGWLLISDWRGYGFLLYRAPGESLWRAKYGWMSKNNLVKLAFSGKIR